MWFFCSIFLAPFHQSQENRSNTRTWSLVSAHALDISPAKVRDIRNDWQQQMMTEGAWRTAVDWTQKNRCPAVFPAGWGTWRLCSGTFLPALEQAEKSISAKSSSTADSQLIHAPAPKVSGVGAWDGGAHLSGLESFSCLALPRLAPTKLFSVAIANHF